MLKRISIAVSAILLVASVAFVLAQGSFNLNSYLRPQDPEQTFLLFGVQILIILLMLGLGFMMVRLMTKLWIAKHVNRAGSRIQTRLVVGALALSVMPLFCMVLFNYEVLSNTLGRWFNGPAEYAQNDFKTIKQALDTESAGRALA